MDQIEIDSAINELPGKIYQETLKEMIKKNLNTSYEQCSIAITAGSNKGDNYLGILYRVSIKDTKGNDLNVIIKLPPANAARREQFFARPSFLRESEFYETIYPMFRRFQEEKGINVKDDGFYQVPFCYESLTEDLSEGLFLEDLKASGFEMFDRLKDVTADHVNRLMESLGKFHALSLAIKDQKPESITILKEMKDVLLNRDDTFKEQMKSFLEISRNQVSDIINENANKDLKQKAHEHLDRDTFEIRKECIDGTSVEPYAVLCHGDCWNNNFMYRYENGTPVEIRLLDWQLIRYSSPVTDLVHYIFGCTTKALRDKHYNEFMDVYYRSLSTFLTRLGSNPSKVFPREVMNEHLHRLGKFGFSMAVVMLPIITSKAEDTWDVDEMAEKFKEASEKGDVFDSESMKATAPPPNEAFRDRMRGVIENMYELNYI